MDGGIPGRPEGSRVAEGASSASVQGLDGHGGPVTDSGRTTRRPQTCVGYDLRGPSHSHRDCRPSPARPAGVGGLPVGPGTSTDLYQRYVLRRVVEEPCVLKSRKVRRPSGHGSGHACDAAQRQRGPVRSGNQWGLLSSTPSRGPDTGTGVQCTTKIEVVEGVKIPFHSALRPSALRSPGPVDLP